MKKFSEQLIKLRTDKNLSQEQLADKLFVSRQAVSKWEKGDSTPDLDNVAKIADILNVSLDELVLGKKNKQPKKNNSEWFHVNNGYEFIAKFWWIIFPISIAIARIIEAIK